MDRPDELQDIIDNYLLGQITPAEQKILDAAIAANPELMADLELEAQAVRAINALGDEQLKNRLQGVEQRLKNQSISTETAKETAKVVPFYRKGSFAIAAAVLLLLVAGWFLRPQGSGAFNSLEVYAANFESFNNIAVPLTRSTDQVTEEQLAYTAYENKSWPAAERLLGNLPATDVNNFYLAQVYLEQGKFPAAEKLLKALLQKNNFALNYATEWYLAMAYLAQGEEEDARLLLKQISETEGHRFADEAREIIE